MARLPLSLMILSLCYGTGSADDALTFERDVRPILKAHCFQCHGESGEREGELDLRLRRLMATGGESGPAIVPGKPDKSLLVERIRDGEMPPLEDASKRVPAEQLDIIVRWIAAGAVTARDEPKQIDDGVLITAEERAWWSFQPVQRPAIPVPQASGLIRTPVDAFLLTRLERDALSFAADADRVTLIRRVYFDLVGVPPDPEDVRRFLADDSPDAVSRLIDRLLNSPWYGDRWGRHWLDVAGYADSEGYTNDDVERPWAWKYRDWVIRSLNADKPFDEFIREQLAGDEMVKPPYPELSSEDIARLTATGFLRMAPDGTGGGANNVELAKNQVMAETIKVVSTSMLGLTVGCAQCHDHRYDPIPQADYYRMRAIFEPTYNWKAWRTPKTRRVSLYSAADKKKAAEIEAAAKKIDAARIEKQTAFIERTFEKELAKLPAEIRDAARAARDTPAKERSKEQAALLKKHPSLNVSAGSLYLYDLKAADELKAMTARATKLRGTKPKEEFVRAVTEVPGQVPNTFLFIRGDHEQPKQKLAPASLTVLHADREAAQLPANDETVPSTGRRLAWARRLTDGTHPLLARVLVNRVWMHHFGRGLVNTPSDFGVLGDRPTHPKLLDWLASEFVASGWSLKQLHKQIMTSTAYRQTGSVDSQATRTIDPDNTLYWRFPLRRLDAETLRDSVLAVVGKLSDKRHGAPIPVMADRVGQFVIGKENLNAGRPGAVIPMKGEEFRKSAFIQSRRSRPLTVLDTFDLPRMEPNCNKRNASTVATQSLLLINSEFIVGMSNYFAARLKEEASSDVEGQIQLAWRLAFARAATADEVNESLGYVTTQTQHFEKHPVPTAAKNSKPRDPGDVALAGFCQMLLSSNEFLYID
jgi:hypothetical protein